LAVTEREINNGITFQREQESDFLGMLLVLAGLFLLTLNAAKLI